MTSDFAPDGSSSRTYEASFQVPRIARWMEFAWSFCAERWQGRPRTATTTRRTVRLIANISSQFVIRSEFPFWLCKRHALYAISPARGGGSGNLAGGEDKIEGSTA